MQPRPYGMQSLKYLLLVLYRKHLSNPGIMDAFIYIWLSILIWHHSLFSLLALPLTPWEDYLFSLDMLLFSLSWLMLTLCSVIFKKVWGKRKITRFPLLWGDTESKLWFKGTFRFRHSLLDLGYPNIFCFLKK